MNLSKFEVRKVEIEAAVPHGFSLMYLSDFHFTGRSQAVADWMLARIADQCPDLLLLGGDYADTRGGIRMLEYFLARLPPHTPRLAVAGNHDYFWAFTSVQQLMRKHQVQWLEHASTQLHIGEVRVHIDGNQKQLSHEPAADFNILLAHRPRVLSGPLADYQLALAGHLHGSQFVFWRRGPALYPGKFFYDWNVLWRQVDGCACYISKGLGDTLPLRYNCKKDVIFVKILPL